MYKREIQKDKKYSMKLQKKKGRIKKRIQKKVHPRPSGLA